MIVGLTVLGACASPAAGRTGDAAWWIALGQPANPASTWPLVALVDTHGSSDAGWHLTADAGGASPTLCRDARADDYRALPGVTLSDFELRVRARTEPGAAESYGVAFRQQGAGNFYLARVDTRNNNLRLYRRAASGRVLLTARDLGVSVGQWHELAVRAAGSRVTVALDGEPALEAADDGPPAGGVALWAGAGTRVCFDGLWLAPRGTAS